MASLSPGMINEQMDTFFSLYAEELPALIQNGAKAKLPKGVSRVYALGNGDSYHAALCAKELFDDVGGVQYIPMPAYTFFTRELPRMRAQERDETLVVCVSASGTSKLAVEILNAVHARGVAHTLALCGREECAMAQAATLQMSTAILDKGRTPGIRTFAASLCGLYALCLALSGDSARAMALAEEIRACAPRIPSMLQSAQYAVIAGSVNFTCGSVLGVEGLLGCAQFVAAKFSEGAGVFMTAEEMEEWCHVHSMAYPLNAPIIVLSGADTQAQTLKLIDTAHRAGRKALVVSCKDALGAEQAADAYFSLGAPMSPALMPLFAFIPLMPLVCEVALNHHRAMFLSDTNIRLF